MSSHEDNEKAMGSERQSFGKVIEASWKIEVEVNFSGGNLGQGLSEAP